MLDLDRLGQVTSARFISSPNCDERPDEASLELLVLHNISLPPNEFGGEAVTQFFTNRLDFNAHPYYQELKGLKVSAHFFIRRDGEIIQFVPCAKRAWHAGVSRWGGRERCNDFSIGVELEGGDLVPFTEAQYQSLVELTISLKKYYPLEDIVGHSDIAPDRKTDPGPFFDWQKFQSLLK